MLHCAAKVGDWGPVDEYRKVNVDGLRNLLDAVQGTPLTGSSTSAGSASTRPGTTTAPTRPSRCPSRTSTATRSRRSRRRSSPCSTTASTASRSRSLRPGFVYGPRDRTVLPRLRRRSARAERHLHRAAGEYALNTIYVGNLVDAMFLAIDSPKAVGEVFNVTDGEFVSKRRFFEAVADGLGLPRPTTVGPAVPVWPGSWRNWRERRLPPAEPPEPAADHPGAAQVRRAEPRLQHRQGPDRPRVRAEDRVRRRHGRGRRVGEGERDPIPGVLTGHAAAANNVHLWVSLGRPSPAFPYHPNRGKWRPGCQKRRHSLAPWRPAPSRRSRRRN